jgi:hypothetical protein
VDTVVANLLLDHADHGFKNVLRQSGLMVLAPGTLDIVQDSGETQGASRAIARILSADGAKIVPQQSSAVPGGNFHNRLP